VQPEMFLVGNGKTYHGKSRTSSSKIGLSKNQPAGPKHQCQYN
jgi:hypothetical protein